MCPHFIYLICTDAFSGRPVSWRTHAWCSILVRKHQYLRHIYNLSSFFSPCIVENPCWLDCVIFILCGLRVAHRAKMRNLECTREPCVQGLALGCAIYFQDQLRQATTDRASPQGSGRLEFQELHLMWGVPSGAVPPSMYFCNKVNFGLSRITRDNHVSVWLMKFQRWCMVPRSLLSFGYSLCKT